MEFKKIFKIIFSEKGTYIMPITPSTPGSPPPLKLSKLSETESKYLKYFIIQVLLYLFSAEYYVLTDEATPTENEKFTFEHLPVLDHNELHKFALQIARGMAHLESKNIVHR